MTTYTQSTTMLGPSVGTPEAWYALAVSRGMADQPDVRLFLEEVYRLCVSVGMRAEVAVVQSWHETANESGAPWMSHWWRTRKNPAGIGITGDPKQNAASRDFVNGKIAARAFIVHRWLYAVGDDLPEELTDYQSFDPRWDAAKKAGYAGKVKTLGELSGTWAADKSYGDKIVAKLNGLVPLLERIDIPDPGPEPEEELPVDNTAAIKKIDRPLVIAIGMGHRNTGRGGALDEFAWTPGAARALARRAKARGMIVELIQENDGDTDPNMSNTDRMTAVRRGVENIRKKHGRVDVVVHMHYNGGGAAGAHFIYRDGWTAPYRREDNMGDVRMCRAIKKHLKATNTVGFLWWSGWPDEAGVMSEKDTGAVARRKGYRLGEKLATDQWRATLYSVIAEAGSIGVKLEAAYIRDPRWVEFTYCEAILNGIEDEVGLYRPNTPDPKPNPTPDPTPVEPQFPKPIRIPELDVYKGAPDTNIPIAVATESAGVAFYIGQDVTVIKETPRMREPGSDESTGHNLNEGEVFHAWWGLIDEESGRPYTYTVWASRIWLDDTDMGMPS